MAYERYIGWFGTLFLKSAIAMKFYQIIVLVVSSVMLTQGITRLVKNFSSQSFLKISTRILVWCGMIVIAFFPRVTDMMAHFVGLEGNINAVILIGFLLAFLIIFRLMSIIERIERDISVLVRKESISEVSRIEKR